MPQLTVALKGALAGCSILIDEDAVGFGLIEDLQSGQGKVILDALADCIVGGDLFPLVENVAAEQETSIRSQIRLRLRRLKPREIVALIEGVGSVMQVPKS